MELGKPHNLGEDGGGKRTEKRKQVDPAQALTVCALEMSAAAAAGMRKKSMYHTSYFGWCAMQLQVGLGGRERVMDYLYKQGR